ncbi:hypothetical protein KJ359_008138 [Pestalotiopsis sp. 9143b]|nr:hypothetical protein KJ359_008138 [Pestalotiopsis sp. 9143b]
MYTTISLLALAASVSATIQGFNYGSTLTDSSAKQEKDFENEFKTAQGLVGASGFTSARLYTMVQAGTANDPISAIQAAINTKTSLLLGLWASGGETAFQSELTALTRAIEQYGTDFTSIVDGISVGSEDLYRNSPQGIAAGSYVGADPDTIVDYINQVRDAIKGTSLSGAQIGHVDTWTAWVNGSNSPVSDAVDWVGVDAYPYFQDTMVNDIGQGGSLFDSAFGQTKSAVGGKPVWVTETGWPVSGKTAGQAEPSTENAKAYWDDVGCQKLFGKVNTWWYTLQDAAPTTPNPSFGVVGSTLSTTPLFDLSCDNITSPSSSSSSEVSSKTASGSASSSATGSSGPQPTGSDGGDTSGSPGAGGIQSSQISIEASATGTDSGSSPDATSSAGSGSGSGSGSSSGSSGSGSSGSGSSGSGSSGSGSSGSGSSGSGSSGSGGNGTTTGSGSSSTVSSPPISSGSSLESFGAAFLAIFVAIMAL